MSGNDSIMEVDQDQYTTINRELGEWIRRLRCQWMSRNPENWGRPHRFFYGLLGAATVFGAWTIPNIGLFESLDFWAVLWAILNGVVPPFWFAWLVSWKDFSHGPVRLYLSGMFLSMLVLYIIRNVVGMF